TLGYRPPPGPAARRPRWSESLAKVWGGTRRRWPGGRPSRGERSEHQLPWSYVDVPHETRTNWASRRRTRGWSGPTPARKAHGTRPPTWNCRTGQLDRAIAAHAQRLAPQPYGAHADAPPVPGVGWLAWVGAARGGHR